MKPGFAKEHGYVETLMGRRRCYVIIRGVAVMRQATGAWQCNQPVQGTELTLSKIAMIHIRNALRKQAKSTMLLQVHDELVFDVHVDEQDWVPDLVAECMRQALPLDVPVEVGIGIADNWLGAH